MGVMRKGSHLSHPGTLFGAKNKLEVQKMRKIYYVGNEIYRGRKCKKFFKREK